jgi:hypothetical protein
MSVHDELIVRYENGAAVLESALRGLPEELLDVPPAPGKWTIRQIAAHVGDAELVACGRFRWIAAEPGTSLKSFDQDRWAESLRYEGQSPEEILEMFCALRRVTAAMLRRLPDEAWNRIGVHEERGPVTLERMVELFTTHAVHHAKQIMEMRETLAPAV